MPLGPLDGNELKAMREAGKVAADILQKIKALIKPGIFTKDIELFFEESLKKYSGMDAAFKGFSGYPAACCVSVNEEVIHGIPSQRLVEDGDIVSVDVGIKYKGLFVDTACTYIAGKSSLVAKKLLKVTLDSLNEGIRQVKPGGKVGDIGFAVQQIVESNGFSVIRKFVGHGVGKQLHLPPEIPNFGMKGYGAELEKGYAIAIEPMVSAGGSDVDILEDGWTAKTSDNTLSAHFEHTIAITEDGPLVLTEVG